MSKREASLKSSLRDAFKSTIPMAVVLRHEDRFTAGIPDFSVTAAKRTVWLEVKHGTPDFDSPGVQELMCTRLARNGYCWYVVYEERNLQLKTLIIEPRKIATREPQEWCEGFDHQFVANFVRAVLI